MNSICFFASYFEDTSLPYYIQVYLLELKKHFNDLVLICSQKNLCNTSIDFLEQENIKLQVELNEGFDFGLWYKAFQKTDISHYDQIALVNDSCILFKNLDGFFSWAKQNSAELQGITQSQSIAPHVQSYFLLINKPAIKLVQNYFNTHKILNTIDEVIVTYEVGLSTYLISNGLTIDSYIDNNNYAGEFSPYYYCIIDHIKKGIPVIKKKIIFSSYRKNELFTLARMNFNISPNYYVDLINQYNKQSILDFKKLHNNMGSMLTPFQKWRYNLTRFFIKILRPIYKQINYA